MQSHLGIWVDLVDALARRLCLRPPDIGYAVDDLSLEVCLIHVVVLDNPDHADTRRSQVKERRRAETASTDAQHPGIGDAALTVWTDVTEE